MLLFVALMMPLSLLALSNNYGYKGTIEIKVGETKTIWLIDEVRGMIGLSTTYYPSGKWVLSDNYYNASMISQTMEYCKVRGDKKGDNIKLTFSGDMILYDAMWEYKGYFLIKVVDSDVPVEKITLDATDVNLPVNGTKQLSATITPSNATNKSVTWSSNKESVATVSSSGLVTAKATGNATITCKANDGSGKYATCNISVSGYPSGYVFSGKTAEGYEMEFVVLDAEEKTCKVKEIVTKNINGNLTIPSSVEGHKVVAIGDWALYKCTMSSISIPNGVETIETAGLQQCENLKTINLPNSLKRLENQALKDCKNLETITGINSLEYIGSYAFENVPWLKTLPDGIIYLGKVLFAYSGDMPKNTVINVKEGTTCIANSAVEWNPVSNTWGHGYNLVGVTVPASVKYIVGNPFGVKNLNSISVDSNNPVFDSRNDCNAIIETTTNTLVVASNNTTIPSTVKVIGNGAFNNLSIKSIVIPNSVDSLGNAAIYDCLYLESIAIGKGLRAIKHSTYYGDDSNLKSNDAILSNPRLKTIIVSPDNPYFDSRDNCNAIIEKSTNNLMVGCATTVIPTSVVNICGRAFYGNGSNSLTSIIIPDNVVRIGVDAFYKQNNLIRVEIGKGVKQIGHSSWGGFGNCSQLKKIISKNEFPSDINEKAFDSNIYKNATLYVPTSSKVNYMMATGWGQFKNIVEGEPEPDIEVDINSTNFPDETFRNYLLSQSYGEDGKITEIEISKITNISVSGSSTSPGSIKSLKGIEYFTALKYLYCSYNQLTSLDLSKNTALTNLFCYNNQLTSLDVSNLTALTYLSCSDNQLTSLDVSRLTALTYLSCGGNQLTSLDVSQLTALTDLYCYNNQLTSLDVSRLTALTSLSCYENQLTSLDVSRLTALTYLSCGGNQLTSLDVSQLTALTDLYCYNNQLTSLDVSRLTALTSLSCYENKLTSLDVSNLTTLTRLYCFKNQLTSLDVSRLTALTYLSCDDNQLTSLDVSKLTALTSLSCYENKLTSLDVSRLTALTYLSCGDNQLTSLDVSKLTALTSLSCDDNQLTSLDVSNLTALIGLYCYRNQLTSLDVSNNTALKSLYCYSNQLASLDVSKNTALTFLSCYKNGIKGTAMDNLISSLPQNKTDEVHYFRVVDQDLSAESNVCTVSQAAAAKARGWMPCYYDSSTKEYVEYGGGDRPSVLKGDVNGDGQVNGTDLVVLTNIILGKSTKTDAADVNSDGQVNGTDYVVLVNIVLGRSLAPRRAASTASLSIDSSFNINAGETKEMVINLTNASDEITLVQFDLRLPDGLSLKQTSGEYEYDIAGRTTWRKHSLDANATNGIIRFLLSSSSNTTLSGTEGAIIKMTILADNSFTGGDIQLENILLVTPDEKETKQETYVYHIGGTPEPTATCLVFEPFSFDASSETEVIIDLNNPDDEITLVQFDLRLPNGLTLKETGGEYDIDLARTTWRKHSLDANATNGIIRFLLASSNNAILTGKEGAIIMMTLKADDGFTGGTIKLENILLVTPNEKEIKIANYEYIVPNPVGINGIMTDKNNNASVYNLSGQRLVTPKKGINIINGQKIIVK